MIRVICLSQAGFSRENLILKYTRLAITPWVLPANLIPIPRLSPPQDGMLQDM